MNKLDKQYTDLLQDILDNGVTKETRNGGTISVFGRQIRHKMSEGFPLLTTKKMAWKTMVTELLWFLRGDTNIKFLVDNNCHIWDGDAYQAYLKEYEKDTSIGGNVYYTDPLTYKPYFQHEFINKIKTDDEFAKKWGELGPVYGKQWRDWKTFFTQKQGVDQISNLINDLKTNPDSRRLMVSAWNVGELDEMVLPPCHYGFQVYTRELSLEERWEQYNKLGLNIEVNGTPLELKHMGTPFYPKSLPTRAISLMWNQRSVDTFLGLPFNIASYGLLLEIIAKAVNMVPDELIGNLGDVHLYSNHIEQAKEQIGRELSSQERVDLYNKSDWNKDIFPSDIRGWDNLFNSYNIPTRTRQPYPLPTLNINTEFWPYEGGSCGEGPLNAIAIFEGFKDENFCKCLLEEDIQLGNYQSHPHIKAPLSN
jgi:thymidylate synthase